MAARKIRLEEIPSQIVDLGMKEGATDVVANLVKSQKIMIRFSNNEVSVSKIFLESVVDVFVMVEKHRATTSISTLSMRNIKKVVKNLVKVAKATPPADVYAPLPQGPFKYDPSLLKAPYFSLNPDTLTAYVNEAIKGALEKGAERAAGTLNAYRGKMYLATSGNVNASQEISGLEISVRAFVSEVATGHAVSIASRPEDFDPGEAGRIAGEIARASVNPQPCLLYTSPSPRDLSTSRMPSSA